MADHSEQSCKVMREMVRTSTVLREAIEAKLKGKIQCFSPKINFQLVLIRT